MFNYRNDFVFIIFDIVIVFFLVLVFVFVSMLHNSTLVSQLKDASAHIFVASKSVGADYGRQHKVQLESLQGNSKVTE